MAKKKTNDLAILSRSDIMKKYPNSVKASEVSSEVLRLPSTFLAFNNQLGGGLPYGKIAEIYGENSSGKTLAAYDFAHATCQLGGVILWVDAEQSWTNDWAEKNGVDLERVELFNSTEVEVISDWMADMSIYYRSILTKNEPILVVLDSIASLDTIDNINSKMQDAKAEMGGRAKAIYKMLRIRSELLASLGVTQVYINQVRTSLKAGMFQDPLTTPGGAALAFFSSIRVGFFGGKTITEKHNGKDRKVGRYTSIRLVKNKTAPPKETIKASPMYFNPKYHVVGFDPYYFLDEVLVDMDIIQKGGGGVYSYKGKKIARGADKFKELLETDEKLRNKLLKKANINSIELTKATIEGISENLYPVKGLTYKSQIEEEDGEED